MANGGRGRGSRLLRGRGSAGPVAAPALVLTLALGMMSGPRAHAETPAAKESGASAAEPAPDVLSVPGQPSPRATGGAGGPGLDDLLRLPSGFTTKSPGRPVAGASEDEWRSRFVRAEKAIGDARESLAATRRELDGLAASGGANQWAVAPPGASGQQSTSPLSFKLRQELDRNREALDAAEKALRELRIEADLAGVPPEWRVVASSPPPDRPSPEN